MSIHSIRSNKFVKIVSIEHIGHGEKMGHEKKNLDYQEFIKKFNNELPKKPKKTISVKDQIIARCILIGLSLVPLSMMFYKEIHAGFYNTLIIFLVSTLIVVCLNQLMSKILKAKYKDIAEKPTDILFSDKSYGPAILARVIVFSLSLAGAIITSYLSSIIAFWNPLLFLLVGYIFFTMIQFKKL